MEVLSWATEVISGLSLMASVKAALASLVKSPRLRGITAAISIVVQPLDHPTLASPESIHTASLSFQRSRNSRPKQLIGVATPPRRSRRHIGLP